MKKSTSKFLLVTVITIATFVTIVKTNNELLLIPYFIGLTYVVDKSLKYSVSKNVDAKRNTK